MQAYAPVRFLFKVRYCTRYDQQGVNQLGSWATSLTAVSNTPAHFTPGAALLASWGTMDVDAG